MNNLYRASGIAGIIAGLVTLAIVILPYIHGHPDSFEERLSLHTNPWYMLRQWLSFLNIFAILLAALGLAVNRFRASPGPALVGFVVLLFYGCTELIGRSIMIFTREYRWVRSLPDSDPATRETLIELVRTFDQLWYGAFPLILITFTISAFLFAWALRGGGRLQTATSYLLFAAAALGTVTFLTPFVPALGPLAEWGYVFIQPASRLAVGVFLLKEAARDHVP